MGYKNGEQRYIKKRYYFKKNQEANVTNNAIDIREYYSNKNPHLFYQVPNTCTDIPNTDFLKSLVSAKVEIYNGKINDNFELVDFIDNNGELIHLVHQDQIKTIETERILYPKLFFQENYSYPLWEYQNLKCYHELPFEDQYNLIRIHFLKHNFAANFIFGPKEKFQCICNKFQGNFFIIAAVYKVPLMYVLYQFAYYKLYHSFFFSITGNTIFRYVGSEKITFNKRIDNKIIYLYNPIKLIPDDLLTRMKAQTALYYWDIELGENKFLCIGSGANKRNRWRIHTFGINKKFVSRDTMDILRNEGLKL